MEVQDAADGMAELSISLSNPPSNPSDAPSVLTPSALFTLIPRLSDGRPDFIGTEDFAPQIGDDHETDDIRSMFSQHTTPANSSGVTFQTAKRWLATWLRDTADLYYCHATRASFSARNNEFAHILVPHQAFKDIDTRLEYALGMPRGTLCLHSRLYIMPLFISVHRSLDWHHICFIPTSHTIDVCAEYLEEYEQILTKNKRYRPYESTRSGKISKFSSLQAGSIHTYHLVPSPHFTSPSPIVVHGPAGNTTYSHPFRDFPEFRSHVSPFAVLVNALRVLEDHQNARKFETIYRDRSVIRTREIADWLLLGLHGLTVGSQIPLHDNEKNRIREAFLRFLTIFDKLLEKSTAPSTTLLTPSRNTGSPDPSVTSSTPNSQRGSSFAPESPTNPKVKKSASGGKTGGATMKKKALNVVFRAVDSVVARSSRLSDADRIKQQYRASDHAKPVMARHPLYNWVSRQRGILIVTLRFTYIFVPLNPCPDWSKHLSVLKSRLAGFYLNPGLQGTSLLARVKMDLDLLKQCSEVQTWGAYNGPQLAYSFNKNYADERLAWLTAVFPVWHFDCEFTNIFHLTVTVLLTSRQPVDWPVVKRRSSLVFVIGLQSKCATKYVILHLQWQEEAETHAQAEGIANSNTNGNGKRNRTASEDSLSVKSPTTPSASLKSPSYKPRSPSVLSLASTVSTSQAQTPSRSLGLGIHLRLDGPLFSETSLLGPVLLVEDGRRTPSTPLSPNSRVTIPTTASTTLAGSIAGFGASTRLGQRAAILTAPPKLVSLVETPDVAVGAVDPRKKRVVTATRFSSRVGADRRIFMSIHQDESDSKKKKKKKVKNVDGGETEGSDAESEASSDSDSDLRHILAGSDGEKYVPYSGVDIDTNCVPVTGAWSALAEAENLPAPGDTNTKIKGLIGSLPTKFNGLATPEKNPMSMQMSHEEVVVGCADGTIYVMNFVEYEYQKPKSLVDDGGEDYPEEEEADSEDGAGSESDPGTQS
ncbi:hypothetical protein D9757_004055 [Collybiopsis confluens]|uniref:Uncharacterized protein n=1 Tax=Collybiopsis confluens TaxID=2823264 RepID=A0A8H5MEE3_9AGAR|nr:hypothetical protein D9757_004055 [Collybiopsis confluens]